MTRNERRQMAKVQTLIGRAKGAYMNDRAAERWNGVVKPLEEAFNIVLDLLSKYQPEDMGTD